MSISIKKFFDSDLADDVRNQYIDALRRGKDSCDVTKQLIIDFEVELLDDDDAPIFWFSLADVQWDMGRLEDTVKHNALAHIEKRLESQGSQDNATACTEMTIKALIGFRDKLSSPQPSQKQIKQYRLYHTAWKIGDVFAYCLDCDAADYLDYHNMYMYFVVKGTDTWHPGHTIPVVYVYWVISKQLLSLDQIQTREYLPQFYKPIAYENNPAMSKKYSLALICTSEKSIPKKRLAYLGKIENIKFIGSEDPSAYHVAWKNFDKYMIENILSWDISKAMSIHEGNETD